MRPQPAFADNYVHKMNMLPLAAVNEPHLMHTDSPNC